MLYAVAEHLATRRHDLASVVQRRIRTDHTLLPLSHTDGIEGLVKLTQPRDQRVTEEENIPIRQRLQCLRQLRDLLVLQRPAETVDQRPEAIVVHQWPRWSILPGLRDLDGSNYRVHPGNRILERCRKHPILNQYGTPFGRDGEVPRRQHPELTPRRRANPRPIILVTLEQHEVVESPPPTEHHAHRMTLRDTPPEEPVSFQGPQSTDTVGALHQFFRRQVFHIHSYLQLSPCPGRHTPCLSTYAMILLG